VIPHGCLKTLALGVIRFFYSVIEGGGRIVDNISIGDYVFVIVKDKQLYKHAPPATERAGPLIANLIYILWRKVSAQDTAGVPAALNIRGHQDVPELNHLQSTMP